MAVVFIRVYAYYLTFSQVSLLSLYSLFALLAEAYVLSFIKLSSYILFLLFASYWVFRWFQHSFIDSSALWLDYVILLATIQ